MPDLQSTSDRPSFLVVGAGVVGLSLAFELSKRGQNVTLVRSDDSELRCASWAGAGILPPPATKNMVDPYDQLRSLSHEIHHRWAVELCQLTGIDTGFQQCGGVYLGNTRAEIATLRAAEYWWQEHGIEFEKLGLTELLELEPQLAALRTHSELEAWLLPGECQLRNPRHLQALAAGCQIQGVRQLQATIERVQVDQSGTACLYDEDGCILQADHICLCTGAWSRMLMEQVQLSNGIMPIRGQMLLYQCESPPLRRIVNDGNRYLVPRSDGFLLAGSVEEEAGYHCVTTDQSLNLIRNWAESILPMLKEMRPVDSWAGLRPGSFDGLPYMGRAPGTNNLYIAAGHFRSGLHMSCGTAEVMSDLMLGKLPAIDLHAFRVGRG